MNHTTSALAWADGAMIRSFILFQNAPTCEWVPVNDWYNRYTKNLIVIENPPTKSLIGSVSARLCLLCQFLLDMAVVKSSESLNTV